MDTKELIIETTKDIDFYVKGSDKKTGVVEAVLVNTSQNGYGDSLGANYKYFGYVDGVRTQIDSGAINMDAQTMNDTYDSIKAGIDPSSTYTEMNLYINSTILKSMAKDKFVDLNPDLTVADFQVKQ